MNNATFFSVLTVIVLTVSVQGKELTGCVSEQFVEYNTTGLIHCKFPPDFDSIYWYDIIGDSEAEPTLTYNRMIKSGDGFSSGEFDIYSNGTLIINKVSFLHEKHFKVLCFLPNEIFNTYHIAVVVTVTPKQRFPRINNCNDTDDVCIMNGQLNHSLICSVHGAKPASKLSWFVIIEDTHQPIESRNTVTNTTVSNFTFYSSAVVNLTKVTTGLISLFVCSSKLQQLDHWTSKRVLVDMQLEHRVANRIMFSEILREQGKRSELSCSSENEMMYLWKKYLPDSNKVIGYGTRDDKKVVLEEMKRYELKIDGTLYIHSTRIDDEGKFICISSDGINGKVAGVELVVLVAPSPSYIIIDKCTTTKCTITTNETYSLTCSIDGVRPLVELQWHTEDEKKISITMDEQTEKDNNNLYHVKSHLHFKTTAKAICDDILILTCEARGAATRLFWSSQDIRIKVICSEMDNGVDQLTYAEAKNYGKSITTALPITYSVVITIVLSIMGIMYIKYRKKKKKKQKERGNDQEMEGLRDTDKRNREQFINDIQISYKEIISTTRVYVHNKLTICPSQSRIGLSTPKTKVLNSYEDIFTREIIHERNILIVGNSGCGKTALTHHVIKTWLRGQPPFNDYDIIIILSLKDVNIMNLSLAIKHNLLPDDSKLTEEDIDKITQNEEKILAIFDDFEQYSEIKNRDAEIYKILSKKKMRNLEVIVLSKLIQYETFFSKRVLILQISLFSPEQVDQYVNKFFSGSEGHTDKIKEFNDIIHQGDLIDNLSMTPIFLFLIASRYNEDVHSFSMESKSSLLSFFVNYMLTKDTDIKGLLCGQKHSSCISKIAQSAIRSKTNSWENVEQDKDICQVIKRFTKNGVLIDINAMKDVDSSKNGTRRLRFSHEIFKYYCAAHYIAYHATAEHTKQFLNNIDIQRNIQLFIYTCGLCNGQDIFNTMINHLLDNQSNEMYPYHIADCIIQCFNESKQVYHSNDLLEKLCVIDHIFHFKEDDSTVLRKAKISLINECSEKLSHKEDVPFSTLSFSNGVQSIKENQITLMKCVEPITVSKNLRTFILVDFEDNVRDTDVLYLVKTLCYIEEVLVYSQTVPTRITDEVFDVLQKRKEQTIIVNWITYEKDAVHMISYPSEVLRCWLNCSEATAIKLYRKEDEWQKLDVKERLSHEKKLIWEMKEKGVRHFLDTKLSLSTQEVTDLDERLNENMETLDDIIIDWHSFYEASTAGEKEQHREEFTKNVRMLKKRIHKAAVVHGEVRSEPDLHNKQTDQDTGKEQPNDGGNFEIRSLSAALKDLFFDTQLKHPTNM